MRRFPTIDLLWSDLLHQLTSSSSARRTDSRVGSTDEIIGYSAVLTDPKANFLQNPRRDLSPSYAAGEMLWYLAGSDSGDFIKHYAPSYERFLEEDGTANGAYGKRLEYGSQIDNLLTLLNRKSNTRQAVISLWRPRDLQDSAYNEPKDVPCTLTLQFIIRDFSLHLIVNMRSNDAWLGLPYDIFCFTTMQQLIAAELGVSLGEYHHRVGSMHLYEKNRQAAIESADVASYGSRFEHEPIVHSFKHMLERALAAEEMFRLKIEGASLGNWSRTLWGQLVMMASSRNNDWDRETLRMLPEDMINKIIGRQKA